jgi:hypothetical protein
VKRRPKQCNITTGECQHLVPLRANWNEVMTTNNLPVADVSLFFGYPLVAMPGGEGGMERKGMAALGSCVTSWLVKEKCGLLLKTKTKVRSQSGERREPLDWPTVALARASWDQQQTNHSARRTR